MFFFVSLVYAAYRWALSLLAAAAAALSVGAVVGWLLGRAR